MGNTFPKGKVFFIWRNQIILKKRMTRFFEKIAYPLALIFLIELTAVSLGSMIMFFETTYASVTSSSNAFHIISKYQNTVQNELMAIKNSKKETLLFVGDIMLSRAVASRINSIGKGDPRFPFLESANFLHSADLTFGNLEGPISSRGKNQGSIYSFRDDPDVVEGLKFAGFDVLSTANNHIFDWGREALMDTDTLLRAGGITPIGTGRNYDEANSPAIFDLSGTKIAFLAYTNLYPKTLEADATNPGISDFDTEHIKKAIEEARKRADIVIVSFHWGIEYRKTATEEQQKLAHEFIDAGADLVIGHHPHVPEEIEKYKGGWVAYSLGNFIFDQNFSKETMGGIAIRAVVENKKIISFNPISISINSNFQPVPLEL